LHETGKGYFWYLLGIITGLSLLTKYTAVLLYPSIFLFTALVPSMRIWFRKKEFYLAFFVSLLMFLPVIIWNYENHWASFAFQLAHGLGEKAFFIPEEFFRNIGAQAGVFSPFLFFFIIYALIHTIVVSVKKNEKYFLFLSFALPVILVFAYSSLSNQVLPHWPAVGYLVLLPVLGKLACGFLGSASKKTVRHLFVFSLVSGGALTLLIPVQSVSKVFPLPADIDITNDLLGWEELADRIREIKTQEDDSDFFVFTHTFYIASQLAFYLEQDIPVYCLSRRIDQYDFWQYPQNLQKKLAGRNGIFFCDDNFKTPPENLYAFKKIKAGKPLEIYHRGKYAKKFYIYRCFGFDTEKTDILLLQSLPFEPRDFRAEIKKWNEKGFFVINGFARKNKALDIFFVSTNWLGSNYILIPIVGFLIWLKKRKHFRKYFWMFALAMILGGLMIHLLKEFFSVPRPLAYFERDAAINILGPPLRSGSFPSGHSQTVFTGVLFLAWLIPEYRILFWIMGILSGLARCYMGVHFPLDILAGFVIALVSFIVVKWLFGKIETSHDRVSYIGSSPLNGEAGSQPKAGCCGHEKKKQSKSGSHNNESILKEGSG